jgi:signal peptidase II
MKTVRRRGALLVGVAAAVVALDQWTKSWAQGALAGGPVHVLGPVNLGLVYNKGAAFSFGTGASSVIAAVAVALVLAVAFYSRRLAKGGAPVPVMVALGLLAGGAVSNLADRFFRHHHGAVVDFIQLVSWWATFNVADAAITVGALTLAISLALSPGGRHASGPARSSARSSTVVPPMSTRASPAPSGTSTAPGGNPDH